MPNYTSKFGIGDDVFLKHDKDQAERMVVQVIFTAGGTRYSLMSGTTQSWHDEIEVSKDKDIVKKVI